MFLCTPNEMRAASTQHRCKGVAKRYSNKYVTEEGGAKRYSNKYVIEEGGRQIFTMPWGPPPGAANSGCKKCVNTKMGRLIHAMFRNPLPPPPHMEFAINMLSNLLFIFYCITVYFKPYNVICIKVLLHEKALYKKYYY